MSLTQLAFTNFKRSAREYAALILALAFSVFIFFNFQSVVYSDSMDVLKELKKDYIDMVVQAASVVFGVFLFFFIWYATNVFLNQRKKEIGIYTFMGLDNIKIGKMYAIEAFFIGFFSITSGLVFGIIFSKLFQMLLMKLSDISVDIRFSFSLKPVLITGIVFFGIFGLMILKGYVSITRSSVLNMLSGAKQEEIKGERILVTILKVTIGIAVLVSGYICAYQTGDINSLGLALAAVVLVIMGVYLLFGGAIPFFIRKLTNRKEFLYQKQRTLWMNSLAYRIQRNYRTYAMVTILMICSVTVLGTAIAMQQRYERMTHFRDTFTYQVISSKPLDGEKIAEGISKENKVEYQAEVSYLMLDSKLFHTRFENANYGIVPYTEVKNAAKEAGLPFDYPELKTDEAIELSHVILLSLAGNQNTEKVQISDKTYRIIADDDTAFMGQMQEQMSIYVLNDEVYEELVPLGIQVHMYNYKIENPYNLEASRPYLQSLSKRGEDGNLEIGCAFNNPESKEESWIRVMYSLCVFMFVTLILAGGSIIFIKLNNEAYEDRERYQVLRKLGIGDDVLYKSIKNEVRFTYYCPFLLMAVTSWFAIKALMNVMKEDLMMVNIYSVVPILVIFTLIYVVSVRVFRKKVLD